MQRAADDYTQVTRSRSSIVCPTVKRTGTNGCRSQMSPINLEDAASFLFAIPFGTVHLVSTVGSPMHYCYIKRKKKNEQQKNKFHQIFPFLAHHLRDLPYFTLVGLVLLEGANTFE